MSLLSAHILRRSVPAVFTAALCAGLAMSGCDKHNDTTTTTGNAAAPAAAPASPSQQASFSDDWKVVKTASGEPYAIEINLNSIKPNPGNAKWRDYDLRFAPVAANTAVDGGANGQVGYTLTENTLDCSNNTSRTNSQRTQGEPQGSGQQVKVDSVTTSFLDFGGKEHEQEIISLVCK